MPPFPPRRRRARPVADAPIDGLLSRTTELAKGWLLALLEQAPLQSAPLLLGAGRAGREGLVHEGPQLCGAVLRALADDLELRRLEPGGPLGGLAARTGELAGAGGDAAAAVRAVDALGDVLWAALREELREPDPDLISDLAQRLALVCGLLRVAALERGETLGGGPAEGVPDARDTAVAVSAPSRDPGTGPVASSSVPASPTATVPSPPSSDSATAVPGRSPSADALWVGALEDELLRADGLPLSLLLAEMEDAERVSATESTAAATAAFEHFARAVRSVVRHQDILVCESDSRAWIIARDTARFDAQALGSRVADAVGAGPAWRGAPLTASVGVAVLGEDGHTSNQLIEAAEEARFAASASGTGVAR
jgi:GGDEF domain-containing protein